MFKNSKKGVSLYLALIIMFILIAIGLGVSLIIVSQMKMIRGMGDSVVAFYAGDTGIEHTLYETRVRGSTRTDFTGSLDGADYQTTKVGDNWKSVGNFEGVKRAVEISYPLPPPSPPWTEPCNNPIAGGICINISCGPEEEGDCTNNFTCSLPSPPCPTRTNASSTNNCAVSDTRNCTCLFRGGFFHCVIAGSCTKTGQCTYTCESGYWNCDGNNTNGCESTIPC